MVKKLAPLMQAGVHVALLNNLGGASMLEMSILAHELVTSAIGPKLRLMVGPAAVMTSLDMRGFSVSVYPVNPTDEALLVAPCDTIGWPGCKVVGPVNILELPDGLSPIHPIASGHPATEAFVTKCCSILMVLRRS